jgi:hypothetical protein
LVDVGLWSKAAALEKIGKSIGMLVERMDVTSSGAPLTDLF